MSVKESIGWCDLTLNPIKGLCQGGCWYCYYSGKRGIAHRFKQDPKLRLDLSVFDRLPKAPKKVFLCSTSDYWGGWIPDEWREAIRGKTQEYPQHTFQVLTKQYQNIISFSKNEFPDNWWVGVTATDADVAFDAINCLADVQANVRFLSFEPLLAPINLVHLDVHLREAVDWLIIGRLTGYGHKYDPDLEWIYEIVQAADKAGIPVFLKKNLDSLIPFTTMFRTEDRKLRQELPSGKQ